MKINWNLERYEVMASYPDSTYKVGDVVEKVPGRTGQAAFDSYPKIFRKLKWYERMVSDFNAMFSIKFCKIVRTHGYWRDGDILPVCGYITDTERRNPVFIGFLLKGYSGPEKYEFDRVEPASEDEFIAWKKENKISITP